MPFLIENIFEVVLAIIIFVLLGTGSLVILTIARRQRREKYFQRIDDLRQRFSPVIASILNQKVESGISFLASRRLRGYTCLPPVWPSAHNIFPQMVPLAPFRPSGVLKTNALPASGSVFSDTAACRGSLRINFSAAKAELPRGHWQPSNPPHHRRKQPPCQMALRQQ